MWGLALQDIVGSKDTHLGTKVTGSDPAEQTLGSQEKEAQQPSQQISSSVSREKMPNYDLDLVDIGLVGFCFLFLKGKARKLVNFHS